MKKRPKVEQRLLHKPWTVDEELLALVKFRADVPVQLIAQELDRTVNGVLTRLMKLGEVSKLHGAYYRWEKQPFLNPEACNPLQK